MQSAVKDISDRLAIRMFTKTHRVALDTVFESLAELKRFLAETLVVEKLETSVPTQCFVLHLH